MQANGRASGPVLLSGFLIILAHCAAAEPYRAMLAPHVTPVVVVIKDLQGDINNFFGDFSPLQIILITILVASVFR